MSDDLVPVNDRLVNVDRWVIGFSERRPGVNVQVPSTESGSNISSYVCRYDM